MPNTQLESRYFKYDIPTKETMEQNGWAVDWASTADDYILDLVFEKDKKKFQDVAEFLKFNIAKVSDIKANISQRGKNEATKYFLIPKELRKGLNFNAKTTCQKIETKTKTIFIYVMDNLGF